MPPVAQPQPHAPHDAEANQKISRLLQQMRQGSVASSAGESTSELDGNSGIPSSSSHLARDEDDMDEDERLLASDEGKKLSSKERRQLRNKVSARAFRSRRKEYISQLEAEVAAKAQESSDLRARNNHLFQQNLQLLQLSQALIRHPAFNSFMEDLSRNPNLLQQVSPQQSQQAPAPPNQQQPAPNNGMAMMPDQHLDLKTLNLGNPSNEQQQAFVPTSQPFTFNMNPQIFAVHEVPAGPSMEELERACMPRKAEMPIIPELPCLSEKEESSDVMVPACSSTVGPVVPEDTAVDDDPRFALYNHSNGTAAPTPAPQASMTMDIAARLLENSLSGKKAVHFHVSVAKLDDDATVMQKLDALLAPAEASCRRVQRMVLASMRQ